MYRTAKHYKEAVYITPLWQNDLLQLEKTMLLYPAFDFLRSNAAIADTMVFNAGGEWLKRQVLFLEQQFSRDLLRIFLEEELMRNPRLMERTYSTSHTTVHTLYHLAQFKEKTGIDPATLNSVAEWGGGYGNMARIFAKMNPQCTYTIIDTALMSCLQWLYLSVSLADNARVHLITHPGEEIKKGNITVLPIRLLQYYSPHADLFLSTWALSDVGSMWRISSWHIRNKTKLCPIQKTASPIC